MVFECFRSGNNGYQSIEDEDSSQLIEWEEAFHCFGYTRSYSKCFIFHVFGVLFAGIPYIFTHWYQQYTPTFKFTKCSLRQAEVILIKDSCNTYSIQEIKRETYSKLRYFHYRCVKFVWDDILEKFYRLPGLDDGNTSLANLLDNYQGLLPQEQQQRLHLYEANNIEIEVKSYWRLFLEEVFNPFYLFQVCSIILWSFDDYYYYAGCVFFLSAVSIVTSLYQTRKQSLALKNLVADSDSNIVQVRLKDGSVRGTPSSNLVPGNIILIPEHGCTMPCDALLLSGNCIVNESMLTGESVPVTKTPPQHSPVMYDVSLHKRHTLFSGTHVIQTRYYGNDKVSALVVRTGFATAKGELVRSMLFPRPMGFQFYTDSMKFVCVLFVIATFGMSYCIYIYLQRQATFETVLLRSLDIITIVVPPALPAAMTAGTVYSQSRLHKQGIFCISPPRINMCGKLKLACFDKTGTLTEEGLDLFGVLTSESSIFASAPLHDPSRLANTAPLLAAMATCHSLTRIEGKLTGDPLDLHMFNATKWELEEPGRDTTLFDLLAPTVVRPTNVCHLSPDELPLEIGIIRQFAFNSNEQCMSVIARTLGSAHMTVYCKGAPEKIHSLCTQESVPNDSASVLMQYTSAGYRVIALAYKDLDKKMSWRQAQKVTRQQVEVDLVFLGFLIMQNMLKPETAPVIQQLQLARIRCVMITGDNLLTAVSVARDCGMVLPSEQVVHVRTVTVSSSLIPELHLELLGDMKYIDSDLGYTHTDMANSQGVHYALDGSSWCSIRTYYPHLLGQICKRGTVFARMAPEHKTQLVEELQALDYVVAMCGDGANDCGALKAAHIGVSLSEAEASVAAPFTSRVANISCVLKLVQEGRCALVTSFGLFKYMALYSLIQFATVLILYTRSSALGNMQFLYVDLVITTSLAVVMGRTGPATRMVPSRPSGSLIALTNLIPLMVQIALTALFQIAALGLLQQQSWFVPIEVTPDDSQVLCWENTSVFCVSCYQYLILALAYSKGKPHRKPQYTNVLFMLTLLSLTVWTTILMVYPFGPIATFFEIEPVTNDHNTQNYRLSLLGLPLLHLLIALMVEFWMADTKWLKSFAHWLSRKKAPKNKYKHVDSVITANFLWAQPGSISTSEYVVCTNP